MQKSHWPSGEVLRWWCAVPSSEGPGVSASDCLIFIHLTHRTFCRKALRSSPGVGSGRGVEAKPCEEGAGGQRLLFQTRVWVRQPWNRSIKWPRVRAGMQARESDARPSFLISKLKDKYRKPWKDVSKCLVYPTPVPGENACEPSSLFCAYLE